jgi:hypothetical protein
VKEYGTPTTLKEKLSVVKKDLSKALKYVSDQQGEGYSGEGRRASGT